MAITTVRQMLQDVARPILVSMSTDPNLGAPERNSAVTAISVVDTVLGDLNVNNVIPNTGRRNADVTSLRDQCISPMTAISNARPFFKSGGLFIYNVLDSLTDATNLIAIQQPSDDVTY